MYAYFTLYAFVYLKFADRDNISLKNILLTLNNKENLRSKPSHCIVRNTELTLTFKYLNKV